MDYILAVRISASFEFPCWFRLVYVG